MNTDGIDGVVKEGEVKERESLVVLVETSKVWGVEIVLAQGPSYCGKKLMINDGGKSSLHFHRSTDETLYVQDGQLVVDVYPEGYDNGSGRRERYMLDTGKSIRIPPNIPHQFLAITKSEVFEFATQHSQDDIYRLENGT